jgi:hypothetical protein
MRQIVIASAIVFISAPAFGQVTVVSGYAGNWAPPPGAYAAPFVPLVTTPSVALGTGLPAQVGASNATAGNVAGATSAPVSSQNMVPNETGNSPTESQSTSVQQSVQRGFEFGVASFETSQGVGQFAGARHAQSARTYTNADVERLNEATGTVRYNGRTERL